MPLEKIRLNLINQSNDRNNSEILIFQKNVSVNFDETHIAWRVIKNLGTGNHHPFTYSLEMETSASDSFGNYTPRLKAYPGQMFAMTKNASGDVLGLSGAAGSPEEVDVANQLEQGAINASIYRDGRLLALKTAVAPQQKAVFKFKPTIFLSVASQIEEGQVLDSAIISTVNTEISLLGVASADIILTGGGPGQGSQPFRFTLSNIQFM